MNTLRDRNGREFRPHLGQDPCDPSDPSGECAKCARHRPGFQPTPVWRERRVRFVIDASVVRRPDAACGMFSPDVRRQAA